MKAKVLKEFRDKNDYSKIYKTDDIIEISKDRYLELKAKELVEEVRDRENKRQKQ